MALYACNVFKFHVSIETEGYLRKFYNTHILHLVPSWDEVVGIMTHHRMDGPGIEYRWRKFFRTRQYRP